MQVIKVYIGIMVGTDNMAWMVCPELFHNPWTRLYQQEAQ